MKQSSEVELLAELSLTSIDNKRAEQVLGGRVHIRTARGLTPLTRLMIEGAAELPTKTGVLAICTSDPLALLSLSALHPAASAHYFHLDLFNVEQALEVARNAGLALQTYCQPDLPVIDPAPDLMLLACNKGGETALALEWMRQAHARLACGGKLLVTINNLHDKWVRQQLERIFGAATLQAREKHGLLYLVKKPATSRNVALAANPADQEHYHKRICVEFLNEKLEFETSYGVFSSDGLDDGSRALLEVLNPPDPCHSILDLGCGWGPMGILAVRRTRAERLTMIDANARAVELARRNAERLGIPNAAVRHEARAESLKNEPEIGAYDLVISNPPYGTEFRVMELFLQAGLLALRTNGEIWVVGKHNSVLLSRMKDLFGNVQMHSRRGYEVIQGVRKIGV